MRYHIESWRMTALKCDSACVLSLEFSIYFIFCRFIALAYTTLDKL